MGHDAASTMKGVDVTDAAARRILKVLEREPEKIGLRIAVEGGGCSGFQYDIRLDTPAEDDLILEGEGQRVVVDSVAHGHPIHHFPQMRPTASRPSGPLCGSRLLDLNLPPS